MSAAYGTEPKETRAFRATQRGSHARRFRVALAHSRRVRLLRIGLPVVAVLGAVVLLLVSWLNPIGSMLARLPISFGDVIVSGSKIKMENPKLSGFTRDKRRYDIAAGAAAQDLTQPGVIELQDIKALFEMKDNTNAKLVSRTGVFDTKKDQLTLQREIVVTFSNGDEGYFEELVVDTKSNNAVSEKPVHLKMRDGTIKSNRFEITNSGEVVRFERGVVANIKMPSSKQAATTP
jgi:lipopolysaccharide export system protein LptC